MTGQHSHDVGKPHGFAFAPRRQSMSDRALTPYSGVDVFLGERAIGIDEKARPGELGGYGRNGARHRRASVHESRAGTSG